MYNIHRVVFVHLLSRTIIFLPRKRRMACKFNAHPLNTKSLKKYESGNPTPACHVTSNQQNFKPTMFTFHKLFSSCEKINPSSLSFSLDF